MTNDVSNTEHTKHTECADERSLDTLLTGIRLALEVTVLAVFVYGAWTARSFPDLASSFPFYASCAGAILTLIVILLDIRRASSRDTMRVADLLDISSVLAESKTAKEARELLARMGLYAGWIIGFLVLVALVSFPIATVVFLAVFLILEGGMRLVPALTTAVIATGFLLLIANLMDMGFPPAFWQ